MYVEYYVLIPTLKYFFFVYVLFTFSSKTRVKVQLFFSILEANNGILKNHMQSKMHLWNQMQYYNLYSVV